MKNDPTGAAAEGMPTNDTTALASGDLNYPGHQTLKAVIEAQDVAVERLHRLVDLVSHTIVAETLQMVDFKGHKVAFLDEKVAQFLSFFAREMEAVCDEVADLQDDAVRHLERRAS